MRWNPRCSIDTSRSGKNRWDYKEERENDRRSVGGMRGWPSISTMGFATLIFSKAISRARKKQLWKEKGGRGRERDLRGKTSEAERQSEGARWAFDIYVLYWSGVGEASGPTGRCRLFWPAADALILAIYSNATMKRKGFTCLQKRLIHLLKRKRLAHLDYALVHVYLGIVVLSRKMILELSC